MRRIAVIIPSFNEEHGIGTVITALPTEEVIRRNCEVNIIVIDNNSTDGTQQVAKQHGAFVIHEGRQGKGYAIRTAFTHVLEAETPYDHIVMLDGDGSYDLREMFRLIDPLIDGFGTVIVGSRVMGRLNPESITHFNMLGNHIFSRLVRYGFGVKITDTLTGYFAWNRDAIERLAPHLQSKGFAIEMEMATKMARLGEEIYSVPISYHKRAGESSLHPIKDGFRILGMWMKNIFWKPQPQKQSSQRKKIAFVSDAVMPFHNGGKERRLYELTKRLTKTDDIHIYTMKWWDGPEKTIVRDDITFHAIGKLRPLYTHTRRSIWQGIMFGCNVFRMFREDFDILDVDHIPFFPLFSARIVAWVKGKPLYGTWHEVWGTTYWHTYMKGFLGIFGSTIERVSFLLPDTIIANSSHTALRLKEEGCHKRVVTIPLGVDFETIIHTEPSPEKSDIIFVGRLLEHKHVDWIIRAVFEIIKTHSDFSCIIIGDGPERSRLETLVKNSGVEHHITFRGSVTDTEKYALMKASRVFVFPSTREGFGLAVIEANAAGLPIITTNHPDNAGRDLVHEGENGFLIEPDATHLAEKILYAREKADTMNPSKDLSEYDWKHITKKYRHTVYAQ